MLRLLKRLKQKLKCLRYTIKVRSQACCCGDGLVVNRRSYVTKKSRLGNNVNFNGMRITGQGEVRIGDNFHSGSSCLIITSFHNYEGSIIQAGSTVVTNIPKGGIAGGHPAKVFKYRDLKLSKYER